MKINSSYVVIKSLLRRTVLAGKLAGEADASTLQAAVEKAASGSAVVLDLAGVQALSSSYFTSAFLPLWIGPRTSDTVPPVLANLSENIVDDVRLAVEANNATLWMVEWKNGAIAEPNVLGKVDALDREALNIAVAEGETDATDLFAHNRSIGLTAWSTRLATLHQKGLLRRRKQGRRMMYAPLWKV
jgi:hypothetical protein